MLPSTHTHTHTTDGGFGGQVSNDDDDDCRWGSTTPFLRGMWRRRQLDMPFKDPEPLDCSRNATRLREERERQCIRRLQKEMNRHSREGGKEKGKDSVSFFILLPLSLSASRVSKKKNV